MSEAAVLARCAELGAAREPTAVRTSLIGVVFLGMLHAWERPSLLLGALLGARVLLLMHNHQVALRIRAEGGVAALRNRLDQRLDAGFFLSGVSWGAMGYCMLPVNQWTHVDMLTIVFFTVASALMLVTTTYRRRGMIGFNVGLAAMSMLRFLPDVGVVPGTVPLIFGVVALAATMLLYGAELNRQARDGVIAALKVEQLTGELRRLNTELEGALGRAMVLATQDPLTHALNRRAFFDAVPPTRPPGEAWSLILFDLDHFKRVNDTHGHAAGDRVLVSAVECARAAARAEDVVARWGGEEFLVLLRGVDTDGAEAIAARIRTALAAAGMQPGQPLVTASFGVTAWSPDEPIDLAVQRADRALYAAKAKGRDRVEVAPEGCASRA